ncbi:hypothetical protein CRH09_34975 [Nocardia terpenica]|uniref:Uncharacterized protein n=1 Tax=Nocardia terpenica TaxID=455432 RepID=A0A291RSS1_9NOCA|nr:hypothetical protein CRH09_34975 [Nocardia terpenica]
MDDDRVRELIAGYEGGATMYELGDRFGIDLRWASAVGVSGVNQRPIVCGGEGVSSDCWCARGILVEEVWGGGICRARVRSSS